MDTAHCHKGIFYKCGFVWIFYSPRINEILWPVCLTSCQRAFSKTSFYHSLISTPSLNKAHLSNSHNQPTTSTSVRWHSPSWMHAHLIAKLIYGQHQLYTNVHRLVSHDCGLYIFIASVASAEHLITDFPSWSSSEASTWSATKYAIGSVGSSY